MNTRLVSIAVGIAVLAACDYRGDFLFPGEIEGVDGVVDLGIVEPVAREDYVGTAIYSEVGPAAVGTNGGATVRFMGTGGSVCIWVDPEGVTWNTAVAPAGDGDLAYPDNIFDDGDLDLSAGQAVYYNGVIGESIGDFRVGYQDDLGNPVEIALNECVMFDLFGESGGFAGRANAEYCAVNNTAPGVEYIAAIQTWSTPLDDDRLSFGVYVVGNSCREFTNWVGDVNEWNTECVLPGEARDEGVVREGFEEFEDIFCDEASGLAAYCEIEAQVKNCNVDRCYCGDPTDLPNPN